MIIPLLISTILTIAPAYNSPDVIPPVTISSHASIQTGVKDSSYRGDYYTERYESKRKCIVQRESNGHYFSTNRSGGYFGAYQMTAPLAHGAGWMMQPELKKMFGKEIGISIARQLRATPAHKWHRFYQDMAFWTIANWKGDGSGLHHWNGGRFTC